MNIVFFLKVFLITVISLWLLVLIYERLCIVGKPYAGNKTTHLANGEFFSPGITPEARGFGDLLKWNFGEGKSVPWNEPYTTDTISLTPVTGSSTLRATFINHATVLLETDTYGVLTDPIFTKRASPFSFIGPARHHDPYVPLSSIPRVDFVVISHAHYDHLSIESIKMIEAEFSPIYLTPLNNGQFIEKAGVPKERIVELDLAETYENPTKDFRVILESAKHWSARGFSDRRRYLWGSFVIETKGRRAFFAGDTAYDTHFSQLKQKYDHFDIALLPIGAFEPRWFMKEHHMNPEEAIQAGKDMGSPQTMGIHFGTFKITDEGRHEPERQITELLKKEGYGNTFLVPTIQNGLQLEVK